ncbi:MauE/DoxX family redox-associated membrane protein [Streptomyces sp. NPDC051940]|uniref:MauE/DoxX family redox-associated membrane protein n=1 Tax=Streptomyces sp. NPDC051940 TaxID=3155675 RepID=UPI00344694C9
MSGFPGALAAAVVALSLLAGALSHLSRPSALPEALRAHGVLPPRAAGTAALAVPAAEGVLGVACVVAWLGGGRLWPATVLALGSGLFLVYAGYARHVTATGRHGPCGCSRTALPMSRWVTRRAVALAVLAAAAAAQAAGAGPPDPRDLGGEALATLLLAAPACALLLWTLPAAMYEPSPPSEGAARSWTSPPAP